MDQRKIVATQVTLAPPVFMELSQAGSQVTVAATAAALSALITAADATATDFQNVDFILLNPEGTVRWLYKSDPTTAIGIELVDGDTVEIRGIAPADLMLIAAGDVLVNVQIGRLA